MPYQEFQPVEKLIRYVESYWYSANQSVEDFRLPVVPDGCMDIIFPLSDDKKPFLVGIMTTTETVTMKPGQSFFGIRFQPAVIPSLLQIRAVELRNKTVSLESLSKKIACKIDKPVLSHNVISYPAYFNGKIAEILSNVDLDERVLNAVKLIIEQQGDISLSSAVKKTGISLRHTERLFGDHVGVNPKYFARIVRFRQSHLTLSRGGISSLSALALQHGYVDQAHFNKEYKSFTGVSPTHRSMSYFYNK